jgi:pimeloyl-ACP methyl ester carboxylesterase
MKYLSIVLVVVCTTSCYEKPVDRFAEINGKKLHVLERGEGEPVVVFLTGRISPLEHLYTVQSQISKETKTFSYDRSGLGLSEILDTVRTYDHVANELNILIEHENIKAPFILVAHSYGGGIAREFYNQFPEKVAGFVFIDAANDEVFFDSLFQKKIISEDAFGPDSLATDGERYEMIYEKENIFWFKDDFTTQVPVHLLIASGRRAGSEELISTKVNTYKQFNKGAPQMRIIFTEHSGHNIQRDQPELVIKSIKELIEEVRNKNPDNK